MCIGPRGGRSDSSMKSSDRKTMPGVSLKVRVFLVAMLVSGALVIIVPSIASVHQPNLAQQRCAKDAPMHGRACT